VTTASWTFLTNHADHVIRHAGLRQRQDAPAPGAGAALDGCGDGEFLDPLPVEADDLAGAGGKVAGQVAVFADG
jgi:hypothetical protein